MLSLSIKILTRSGQQQHFMFLGRLLILYFDSTIQWSIQENPNLGSKTSCTTVCVSLFRLLSRWEKSFLHNGHSFFGSFSKHSRHSTWVSKHVNFTCNFPESLWIQIGHNADIVIFSCVKFFFSRMVCHYMKKAMCEKLKNHYVQHHLHRYINTLCEEEYIFRMGFTRAQVEREIRYIFNKHLKLRQIDDMNVKSVARPSHMTKTECRNECARPS